MELIEVGHFVLNKLNESGYEAYFVGGMVRDQLLGRKIYDVDITTSAQPEIVQSLFEKTYATGIAHGTITVVIDNILVEVTTFRVEGEYLDYRHPKSVAFTASLDEDLQRRDFTINAMVKNRAGELYDPLQGLNDLQSKTLRAVGHPEARFKEDPLRMLRAIRFVSKLGFKLANDVYLAIKNQRHLLKQLAKERIKKELYGVMEGNYKDQALALLFETKLLDSFEMLQPLHKYQTYSFKSLQSGLDFFVLAGYEVVDLSSFLMDWPFSKAEKRSIKLIKELLLQPLKSTYIQYYYGVEIAYLYHRFQCFLEQKEVKFIIYDLPITSLKDIEVTGADLLQLTNRKKGPWVGQLLAQIESEIVSGKIDNKKDEILEFVYRQGAIYEKEEKD